MTVFTCEDHFEAMMTCVYEAWASRCGHRNIRLELEPVEQGELFCEYISVTADAEKAQKVVRAVKEKISSEAYRMVYLAAMSCASDKLDAIYRFLIVGFACGRSVTEQLSWKEVSRVWELSRKAENEAHKFREFVRFLSMDGQAYAAHIEPQCNITSVLAAHFAERMPSENWLIVDDNRRVAAVHPKNGRVYLRSFTEEEMKKLPETEKNCDAYTELWKEFFRSTGIAERKNPRCQKNLAPQRYRKHITEFAHEAQESE